MSRQIAEIGKMQVISFYGGNKRGTCLQFTPQETHRFGAYAQLTYDEVEILSNRLLNWLYETGGGK